MRGGRFLVLACLACGLAGSVPSLGLSRPAPTLASAQQACGRLEFISGLEAVFGRRKTHQQALAFRTQVTGRGFVNANIIEGCDGFRVVVRGIDTFDVGVDLQSEARREGFAVTLECIQAKPLGRLEAIFGHGRDRPTATAIVNRADAAGFPGVQLRSDPCGGFEAYLAGFEDQREADAFVVEAKARGFDVVLERN
ncbi:MAG TPA: hypothetical protein VK613_06340 [Gaiellaceae bacterium]|nr:hypothetical protein [Gaiellaceae bacterium]